MSNPTPPTATPTPPTNQLTRDDILQALTSTASEPMPEWMNAMTDEELRMVYTLQNHALNGTETESKAKEQPAPPPISEDKNEEDAKIKAFASKISDVFAPPPDSSSSAVIERLDKIVSSLETIGQRLKTSDEINGENGEECSSKIGADDVINEVFHGVVGDTIQGSKETKSPIERGGGDDVKAQKEDAKDLDNDATTPTATTTTTTETSTSTHWAVGEDGLQIDSIIELTDLEGPASIILNGMEGKIVKIGNERVEAFIGAYKGGKKVSVKIENCKLLF